MPLPGSPAVAADAPPPDGRSGARLVIGLLLLGVSAGIVGIWYQRGQTRRCLAFYGPAAARMVTSAPVVEVWALGPSAEPGVLRALERRDVSQAPGLVHLRRGLVEDANFRWQGGGATEPGRLPAASWDRALVFTDPAAGSPPVVLVIDLVDEVSAEAGAREQPGELGSLAVVGRPGRISLGRIGRGLRSWLRGQP